LYPLNWQVFQHSLTATEIPEMHDHQIIATGLYLRTLGHTASIVTKDDSIASAGLVPTTW
jgi:hypothetical protein